MRIPDGTPKLCYEVYFNGSGYVTIVSLVEQFDNIGLFQQHDWTQPPTVISVAQAVAMYNGNKQTSSDSFLLPTMVGTSCITAVATGFAAYRKLRRRQT